MLKLIKKLTDHKGISTIEILASGISMIAGITVATYVVKSK